LAKWLPETDAPSLPMNRQGGKQRKGKAKSAAAG
jgi:hypothetical protein